MVHGSCVRTDVCLWAQRPAVVDGPAVHAEQPGAAQPGQAAPLDARDLFTNGYL
jgi:hypothetical protein